MTGCCCNSGPITIERMAETPLLLSNQARVELSSAPGKEAPTSLVRYSLSNNTMKLALDEDENLWGHSWLTNFSKEEKVKVRFLNEYNEETIALQFSEIELVEHQSKNSYPYLRHYVILSFGQVEIV